MPFDRDLPPLIRKFLRALAGTMLPAIMLTACVVDYPAPEGSWEGLTRKSDQVVVGMVAGTAGHEVDWGTADPDPAGSSWGFPVVYYEVAVTETLRGEELPTLVVVGLNPLVARGFSPGREAVLVQGQQVLLYLEQLTNRETPSLDLHEFFFAPVGGNNGVFDIGGDGAVVPRLSGVFSNLTFTLAEVRNRVANTEVDSETAEYGAGTLSGANRTQPIWELCKGVYCPYLD